MAERKLTVIGGGQMARALVGGMLAKEVLPLDAVCIVVPSQASQEWWSKNRPGIHVVGQLSDAPADSDAVLLAVKPNVIPQVLQQADASWQNQLVVSIAAGVSLANLCRWTGHQRVVRVMPNTPSLVGAGASGFALADEATEADAAWIEQLLGAVGVAVRVNEYQLDAVTGVSGSGPAYVFMIIEALADGGVLAGLPRPLAMQLATQTVLGAATMVAETGCHPGELKDAVTSPGGTTIAAVQSLEQNGLRSAMITAVATAAQHSRNMQA